MLGHSALEGHCPHKPAGLLSPLLLHNIFPALTSLSWFLENFAVELNVLKTSLSHLTGRSFFSLGWKQLLSGSHH